MIIDTSVVIDAIERRDEAAIRHLDSLERRSTRSMVTFGELEFGVRTAGDDVIDRRRKSLELYRLISEPVVSLPLDQLVSLFGDVSAEARRRHITVGQNDRWFIAEALLWDETLWTADVAMHALCDVIPAATSVLIANG